METIEREYFFLDFLCTESKRVTVPSDTLVSIRAHFSPLLAALSYSMHTALTHVQTRVKIYNYGYAYLLYQYMNSPSKWVHSFLQAAYFDSQIPALWSL